LAKVRDKWRDPKYIAELLEREWANRETLDRIRKRDGTKFFNEAVDYLLQSIIMSVESHTGPIAPRDG
jgi:hypothetical protein